MNLMMKYNHWLPQYLGVNGIVLFGTVYFAMTENEVSERLYRHEKEHLRQQEKDGMLYFKVRYIIEFLINLLKYKSFFKAYYNISYEVKARETEDTAD